MRTNLILTAILGFAFQALTSNADPGELRGPEKLLIDTIQPYDTETDLTSVAAPTWIKLYGLGGFPEGSVVGVAIKPPYPLEITRAEFDLVLTNDNSELENTKFTVAVVRNPGMFEAAIEDEPIFYNRFYSWETNFVLEWRSENRYTLKVPLEPFIWGAERIFEVYSSPVDEYSPFARISWVHGNSGSTFTTTTYRTDELDTKSIEPFVPGVRIWAKAVLEVGLKFEAWAPGTVRLTHPPGVMLGRSDSGAAGPWDWFDTDYSFGETYIETEEAPMGFFQVLPDSLP